ncbi:hypothetical protein M422DRAFT_238988 [Sphaerobolus stellatus SS14]|nr:hypothetical protein M422DRAFT_238988 [Sphaerobolus stellatus SS14]
MALVIPNITVANAATMLNAFLTFIQYTLGLALIAILIYILPTVNNANTATPLHFVTPVFESSSFQGFDSNEEAGYNTMGLPVIDTVESLILREGIFVVDGLIVDMAC